jgi:hypothetical protein
MTPAVAAALTELVAEWVRQTRGARALAMVGSWARGNPRPDSDLDLLVLANEPDRYFRDPPWPDQMSFNKIGHRIESHSVEDYGAVRSYHIMLTPPAELELSFGSLGWASTAPADAGTVRIVSDACKIIVDKDALLQRLLAALDAQTARP